MPKRCVKPTIKMLQKCLQKEYWPHSSGTASQIGSFLKNNQATDAIILAVEALAKHYELMKSDPSAPGEKKSLPVGKKAKEEFDELSKKVDDAKGKVKSIIKSAKRALEISNSYNLSFGKQKTITVEGWETYSYPQGMSQKEFDSFEKTINKIIPILEYRINEPLYKMSYLKYPKSGSGGKTANTWNLETKPTLIILLASSGLNAKAIGEFGAKFAKICGAKRVVKSQEFVENDISASSIENDARKYINKNGLGRKRKYP